MSEIKCRLVKLPVLYLPDNKGRFHLYSDTSKFTTGSALYQIQKGKSILRAYISKRLPIAARNYSNTELGMCRLAINMASFVHLLKRVDVDVIVDHLALTHIIKSKAEPTTTRIKCLLEILSSCLFNLYYIKGKSSYLVISYLDKNMFIAINMQKYQFHSTCRAYYILSIIIRAKKR